jgi:2-hydroxychromene-2-carboxylate isomerase
MTVRAAALDGADWFALTERLQRGFWSERANIGDADTRRALADEIGLDGARLVAREGDADVQARWDENNDLALNAGVFGSPTFRLGDALYWGQDSLGFLDDALAAMK